MYAKKVVDKIEQMFYSIERKRTDVLKSKENSEWKEKTN